MYNNYNPYYPNRYQAPVQPQYMDNTQQNNMVFNGVQNRSVLNGKQVDSVEVVKAMDIPLDGSVSYFPLADGTAIVTKQLRTDGTSKTIVYKPVVEEEKEQPKYVTVDEFNKAIKKIEDKLKKKEE